MPVKEAVQLLNITASEQLATHALPATQKHFFVTIFHALYMQVTPMEHSSLVNVYIECNRAVSLVNLCIGDACEIDVAERAVKFSNSFQPSYDLASAKDLSGADRQGCKKLVLCKVG